MAAHRLNTLSGIVRQVAQGFWLSLFAATLNGCETSCADKGQAPILYSDGIVEESEAGRVYMTTPYDGTWLHFPSQRRFRLQHGLGTTSLMPSAYVSFYPNPVPPDGGGGLSEAAGNEVIYEAVTEQYVQVRNDTCSEFFLLVRLETAQPSSGDEGEGAAGADGS
jgi:hypothetical protein